jgi:hypothetical protein
MEREKVQGAPLRRRGQAAGAGWLGGWLDVVVSARSRSKAEQSRLEQSSEQRRRSSGTTSIKHDGLPVLAGGVIGRAAICSTDQEQWEQWRGRDGFICVLSQNTPANHAAGALREVCRRLVVSEAAAAPYTVGSPARSRGQDSALGREPVFVSAHEREPPADHGTVAAAVEGIRRRGTPSQTQQPWPPQSIAAARPLSILTQTTSDRPTDVRLALNGDSRCNCQWRGPPRPNAGCGRVLGLLGAAAPPCTSPHTAQASDGTV